MSTHMSGLQGLITQCDRSITMPDLSLDVRNQPDGQNAPFFCAATRRKQRSDQPDSRIIFGAFTVPIEHHGGPIPHNHVPGKAAH